MLNVISICDIEPYFLFDRRLIYISIWAVVTSLVVVLFRSIFHTQQSRSLLTPFALNDEWDGGG